MTIAAFLKNDTVQRVYRTVVQAAVAQFALQSAVSTSPTQKAAVAGGAGVLSFLWNVAANWFTNVKSAKLDRLAQAIDDAVDKRLAAQAAQAHTTAPLG